MTRKSNEPTPKNSFHEQSLKPSLLNHSFKNNLTFFKKNSSQSDLQHLITNSIHNNSVQNQTDNKYQTKDSRDGIFETRNES